MIFLFSDFSWVDISDLEDMEASKKITESINAAFKIVKKCCASTIRDVLNIGYECLGKCAQYFVGSDHTLVKAEPKVELECCPMGFVFFNIGHESKPEYKCSKFCRYTMKQDGEAIAEAETGNKYYPEPKDGCCADGTELKKDHYGLYHCRSNLPTIVGNIVIAVFAILFIVTVIYGIKIIYCEGSTQLELPQNIE